MAASASLKASSGVVVATTPTSSRTTHRQRELKERRERDANRTERTLEKWEGTILKLQDDALEGILRWRNIQELQKEILGSMGRKQKEEAFKIEDRPRKRSP